jgi:phage terminase small subunit
MKLTTKQQRFVDFYDGNATKAAKLAGYKGSDKQLTVIAAENMAKPNIAEAIRKREEKHNNPVIMEREERQALWTRIARGEELQEVVLGTGKNKQIVEIPPKMQDRLRASELLGKSECDFSEKRIIGFDEAILNRILSFFSPEDAEQIRNVIIEEYKKAKSMRDH